MKQIQVRTLLALFLISLLGPSKSFGHGVAGGDQGYIQEVTEAQIVPYIYLGAKHMVTGYDHLLFLVGVVFFLYKLREVGVYVTLFAVGHSSTLLLGVFLEIKVSAYLIDAIIGLSVVCKNDYLSSFCNRKSYAHSARCVKD